MQRPHPIAQAEPDQWKKPPEFDVYVREPRGCRPDRYGHAQVFRDNLQIVGDVPFGIIIILIGKKFFRKKQYAYIPNEPSIVIVMEFIQYRDLIGANDKFISGAVITFFTRDKIFSRLINIYDTSNEVSAVGHGTGLRQCSKDDCEQGAENNHV